MIPKLRGLTLSGIVFERSMGVEDNVQPATGSSSYVPGERAEFAFQVINAPNAKESKTGSLMMRTRLFRDGAQVYESAENPITPGTAIAGRFFSHGSLEIPANLTPGEYLMRVEVEDAHSPASHARAWQWARVSIRAASSITAPLR